MAFLRRKRETEMAVREEMGENFWREDFPISTRNRILYLFADCINSHTFIYEMTRAAIFRSEGVAYLNNPNLDAVPDFLAYCQLDDDDKFCEAVERFYEQISNYDNMGRFNIWNSSKYFQEQITNILLEDRISWDFIEGMLVPRASNATHSNILLPTLTLLRKPEFHEVNATFLKGLSELTKRDAGDAITDFGTALQLFLAVKGCTGDTLGAQKNYGTGKGFLTSHQGRLIDLIADLRNKGEVHNADHYEMNKGWLMSNLVGSLILSMEDQAA